MSEKATRSGVTFTELLLVVFITLRLCKVIDWSWWWVLAPAWIPLGIAAICLAAVGLILGGAMIWSWWSDR